jgi:ABC-type transport system substrate-binding protein
LNHSLLGTSVDGPLKSILLKELDMTLKLELSPPRAAGRFKPAATLIGALVALSALASPVMAQSAKDVLVIGKAADPQTLDPGVTMDNNDWTASYHAYQRLVRYKSVGGKGSTEVEPELAESWTISKDGLTWDFKLKAGQKFDDGTAVNAAAIKYSFDRLFALKQGPSEAFPAGTVVTVVGPMQVRFQLASAYTPFLYTPVSKPKPKMVMLRRAGWLVIRQALVPTSLQVGKKGSL